MQATRITAAMFVPNEIWSTTTETGTLNLPAARKA
jgi:hypothetical protein